MGQLIWSWKIMLNCSATFYFKKTQHNKQKQDYGKMDFLMCCQKLSLFSVPFFRPKNVSFIWDRPEIGERYVDIFFKKNIFRISRFLWRYYFKSKANDSTRIVQMHIVRNARKINHFLKICVGGSNICFWVRLQMVYVRNSNKSIILSLNRFRDLGAIEKKSF